MTQLAGRTAVITGGSRGIGAAIAHAMSQAGAKVVVASRKPEGVNAVAEAIRTAGGEALPVAAHMGKPEQIKALFDQAEDAYGQLDILVNNAATNPYFGPLLGTPWAAWDKTFEVNLKGYFGASVEFCQRLTASGAPGAVINIASILGQRAAPAQGVYGMTKAAVISMTQTLALELGGTGIRVNAIAPGVIETRLAQALVGNEAIARGIRSAPARRFGRPEDIAGLAVFLASDAADYITGETIVADGGLTLAGLPGLGGA